MKAAVIFDKDQLPQYTDIAEPTPQNHNEILVSVKAVALKHFDKGRAAGKHYSIGAPQASGHVAGGDGVCLLPDGRRVYGMAINGMLAEKALIHKDRIVTLPHGLEDTVAAALPNAVLGAAMGLRFKAGINPGDVVLINGATGFTGRVAVQIAKHYGAAKVIATGRDQHSLHELTALGADEIITITGNHEQFGTQIKSIHTQTPIDIVIDYLWGHTAEIILNCFKGDGSFTNKIRYVSVGSMAGDIITLSAAIMRSVDLQLTGSGLGSWTKQQVGLIFSEILPEMFGLAAEGKLRINVIAAKLEHIVELWDMPVSSGQRLVVTI